MRTLTSAEIIFLGQVQAARQTWEQLHDTALALFGLRARSITCSRVTVPGNGQEFAQGPELIVTDASGQALPIDPAAPWWQMQDCQLMQGDHWQHAHLAVPIGATLPEPIRSALRSYLEAALHIEFVQTWEAAPPLVIMADLAQPPALPFHQVQTADGHLLSAAAIIQAGQEWERHRTWDHIRAYVHQLYGPHAGKMTITSVWIYNDESYNERPFFRVIDGNDRQIPYDLTLPWWQRLRLTPDKIAAYCDAHQPRAAGEREPIDYDGASWEDRSELIPASMSTALDQLRTDLLGMQFREIWEEPPAAETEYDLLTPPPLHYPILMADAT